MKDKIKELTLLLMYLNSWEEKGYGRDENENIIEINVKKSWKGYDFDILNELADEEHLYGGYKDKYVLFTEKGETKALELYKKYFGDNYEN